MTDTVLKKFDMTGKTAIVTGAAGLLGKQFSLTLAQAGASVVLADLDESLAESQALSCGSRVCARSRWRLM